ncbi:hypothetical protein [Bernardetia sp.]|uniref:hypothetical protein n=1 Tax=Bernardetia sp. TaxID=1937974 RepID=UPI0025BCC82C|nr:hypothetical protein [Bernardetia sp.]
MKTLKTILSHLIYYTIFVLLGVCVILFIYKINYEDADSKLNYLRLQGKYTIGNVIMSNKHNEKENTFLYDYEYYVRGKRYTNTNASINALLIKENEKYLVIFSQFDPSTSLCLLHKPIRNLNDKSLYSDVDTTDLNLIVILLGEYYVLYIVIFYCLGFVINMMIKLLHVYLGNAKL